MDKIDSMVGRWEQAESKNFDEYLKAIGLNANVRAMASQVNPSMIIEKNGKLYKMTVVTPQKTVTTEFELGKEFKETTGDGRECWSTIRMVDGKMVHEQKGVKNTHYERWLEGDKLMMTGECDGIKYHRVFKREGSKE